MRACKSTRRYSSIKYVSMNVSTAPGVRARAHLLALQGKPPRTPPGRGSGFRSPRSHCRWRVCRPGPRCWSTIALCIVHSSPLPWAAGTCWLDRLHKAHTHTHTHELDKCKCGRHEAIMAWWKEGKPTRSVKVESLWWRRTGKVAPRTAAGELFVYLPLLPSSWFWLIWSHSEVQLWLFSAQHWSLL